MALINPQALHLEPGDLVALTLPAAMDVDDLERVMDEARRLFPDHKTLVLADGFKIEAVPAERLRELLG